MAGVDNSKFIPEGVRAMNEYRKLHQVEPLVHNPELDKIAQTWSDHLASTDSFSHNPNAKYKDEKLGENCAMKGSSDRADYSGQQCIDQWYSEIERYDFTKNSGPSTGHFTQVVWKSSREVGLGRSQTKDGKWLIVGNFYPAGNYIGENAKNVFPTKDGTFKLPPKDEIKNSTPVASDHGHRETMSSKAGESVSRSVKTETTGSGPNAVTKKITTETRTGPDGKTHVTTSEEIIKGPGAKGHDSDDTASGHSNKEITSSKSGESVSRSIKTETTGSGANAVTKKITTETRTGPDGKTHVTTSEEIIKGPGAKGHDNDDLESKFKSFGMDKDDDFKGHGHGHGHSGAPAAAEAPKQSQEDFIKDVLHWHDVHRAKHQVAALTENKELTAMAQKWAEHLASTGGLSHSNDKYKGQPIGENCAAKSGTGHVEYTGQGAVDQWYSESSKFDYSQPEGVPGVGTGHFSQVVWKSSKEIGIGRASSADGRKAFVVCNYFPAGNYRGEYAANVLPPK